MLSYPQPNKLRLMKAPKLKWTQPSDMKGQVTLNSCYFGRQDDSAVTAVVGGERVDNRPRRCR